MGEEIFPHHVLSTTSTICEVKFGKERKIVAHFMDKDPETCLPTKEIYLKENPNKASEKDSYLQQISPYVHMKSEREKGSIYKRIELFWPHSLLEVIFGKGTQFTSLQPLLYCSELVKLMTNVTNTK